MICKKCGTENEDGVKFCKNCGADLTETQTASVESAAVNASPASSAPAAAPAQQHISSAAPASQAPVSEKGSATQAWADIRKEDKWFSKCLVLALIMLVPILNFCAIGYIWGLSKTKLSNDPSCYPKKMVCGETFKNGFFCWVIGIVFGCVYFLLSLIPFLGPWLTLAAVVFLLAVSSFMYLRVVNGSFGCAFSLGNVFNGYGKQFGKSIGTNILPSLIFAAIGLGFFLIYFLITLAIAANAVTTVIGIVQSATAYAAQLYSPAFWIGKLGGSLSAIVILTAVFAFVCNILGALLGMILARANAIHVQRYIPEWIDEFKAVQSAKAQVQ